ncbi:MAG: serine hydrolase domain-containing protein [Ferruginibacter sp.]
MKLKLLLSLLGLTIFTQLAFAQAGAESLDSFIKQAAEETFQKEKVPGVFVAVLNNGNRSYFSSGYANPDTKSVYDSATVFEIGSITKTFTAYVLMGVLHEKGISDTDPIIGYLPDSVKKNVNIRDISFLSLMNHTSGLPRLPGNMKMNNPRQPYENYTENDLYTYLKDCEPKPDGKSNYSNLGAGLAGVLAERISGKSYAQLLDQHIFLPFKLVTAENAVVISDNKSQGYFAADDKTPYWNMNVLAPAGGLKCNGAQMLSYLQNMCFPETDNSKQLIDKLTTQTVAINAQVGVGRAWHIINANGKTPVFWHNGGTYGFSTFCAFLKDKSKAVVVIINQFNKNAICDGLGFKIMSKLITEQ